MFRELVKRDFAKNYKRTILGVAWSILSPLMKLLIMRMVFNLGIGAYMYKKYNHDFLY